MRTSFLILAAAGVAAAFAARAFHPATPTLYPRFRGVESPPLPVELALKSFQLAEPGLQIRCVAAEPLVEAPVAAQFDEQGRLWVVQMVTYMPDVQGTGELAKRNRVSILSDSDGDGAFDKAVVFLDDLALPRAVSPCFDGALVLEPPNLLFCRDTNGDGRADERIVLLSGFGGIESPEHAGNGLLRGIDNWYHCSQHDVEFRIWMKQGAPQIQTRRVGSHGQWGIAEDGLGRLYYTPNSNPLLMDLYPKHWGAMNPHASTAGLGMDIMRDTSCWPIHPTPGVNRGYQERTLRKDGTLANLTAACGTMIVNDGRLLPALQSDAMLCEAAGNLVKRARLEQKQVAPAGTNRYERAEFLASSDERFRPVNLLQTPDGAILVLDMYRGVIQHKVFITPFLKEQSVRRNLETPLNMGRIYRIEPEGSRSAVTADLRAATRGELVEALRGNDWAAAQAQRLLVERQDKEAATLLHTHISSPPALSPRALWTLEGIGELSAQDCLATPQSSRYAALLLCIGHIKEDAFAHAFVTLAETSNDPALAPLVAAGWAAKGDDAGLLRFLAGVSGNAPARAAALCFLKDREEAMLESLSHSNAIDALAPLLGELFSCCLRSGIDERTRAIALITTLPEQRQRELLERLASHMKVGSRFPKPLKLATEPTALLRLAGGNGGDARLAAIMDQLEWPGHQVKEPPIRPLSEDEQRRFERGEFVYETCAACHQKDGKGSPGQAPPLAGSALATGPADKAIKIVLHGLTGKYEVNGQKFEGAMPVPQVGSDQDIASVLTFIRRNFGNTAEPIDAHQVAEVRRKFTSRIRSWSREELERSNEGGAP